MKGYSKRAVYIAMTLTVGLGLILLIIFLDSPKDKVKYKEINTEATTEIKSGIDSALKIQEFVRSNIPDGEVFIKLHSEEEHEEVTADQMKTAAVEMFYGAIKSGEIDYLSTAVTPETFQGLWGTEMDFVKREQLLKDFLQELDRGGTLKGMSYKVFPEDFGVEGDEGEVLLTYEDGSTKTLPFEFSLMGDGHEEIYQLSLPSFVK